MDDLLFFNGIIPYLVMLYLSMSIISYLTDYGVKNFSFKELAKHFVKVGVWESMIEYKRNRKLAEFVVGTVVIFVGVAFLMAFLSVGFGFLYEYRAVVITLILVGVAGVIYYYTNLVNVVDQGLKEATEFTIALVGWLAEFETGMDKLVPEKINGVYISPLSDGKTVCIYQLEIALSRYDFDKESMNHIMDNNVNSVCKKNWSRWMPDRKNPKFKFVEVNYMQQTLILTVAYMENPETLEVLRMNKKFNNGQLDVKHDNPIDPNFG